MRPFEKLTKSALIFNKAIADATQILLDKNKNPQQRIDEAIELMQTEQRKASKALD